ncbi:hypothetical protein [Lapillicoccus sp.]|uniref:type I-G CRISPR-associated helicase/endonuclease Cas3g n=1 Tax=Lapillicoccus sp. TaxID=1909287 RepID=UPI0025EA7A6F|nr:hypothetical protein [Lapillicoccus sp.]
MGLTRDDFAAYFAALHDGHPPFAWQERLLDTVLQYGGWPDKIVAPTGSGKTAVIDVHVFAQALTAEDPARGRPPRRLSLVVGRRVLVDDQFDYARALSDRLAEALTGAFPTVSTDDLAEAGTDDLMTQVAQRLWRLRRARPAGPHDRPLVVGKLRGGQPPSRGWRIEPTAAAVICATPDMWGSRLLFRGYGSSPRAWPVEAGLLAFDTALVVDEAHLARQLLVTARSVAHLATIADTGTDLITDTGKDVDARTPTPPASPDGAAASEIPSLTGLQGPLVRPLQVVETTATPTNGAADGTADGAVALRVVGVDEGDVDLPAAAALRDRLTRPKPLTLTPVAGWTGTRDAQRRVVVNHLADAVQVAHEQLDRIHGTSPTVGCFVNTVLRAVEVAAECRRRGLRVVMVCGRTRARDVERLRTAHPGVLAVRGNDDVDVVVTTQSLEVGVDLDFAAVVTELAEASALAQRAGRLNRRGLRPTGPLTIVVPEQPPTQEERSGPYDGVTLADALAWVKRLALHPAGINPWQLRADPPPAGRPRRIAYQHPQLADAWHWARTSEDLAAEPELDLWLAEDLENSPHEIGLVVRDALPVDPEDAVRLITDLRPTQFESFPVDLRAARDLLRDWRAGTETDPPVAVLVRGEDVGVVEWTRPDGDARGWPATPVPVLRPGDTVVIDATASLFTTSSTSAAGGGFSPPVPVPGAGEEGIPERHPAADVLTGDPQRTPAAGEVVLRLEAAVLAGVLGADAGPRFDALARALCQQTPTGWQVTTEPADLKAAVRGWLDPAPAGWPAAAAAAALLGDPAAGCDVVVHQRADTDEGDDKDVPLQRIVRVLVIDRRRLAADDEVRQAWTPSRRPVTLDAHQRAVADRAHGVGTALGLPPAWVDALRLAGAHHDDGKADERFQVRLGRRIGDPLLAKSVPGSAISTVWRRQEAAGLPRGWRHEQLSVVHSWPALHQPDLSDLPVWVDRVGGVDGDLVSRLIGTSHGHGRSGFPHVAAELTHQVTDLLTAGLGEVAGRLFDEGDWDALMERTHRRYGVWLCAYLEAVLRAADNQVSGEGS